MTQVVQSAPFRELKGDCLNFLVIVENLNLLFKNIFYLAGMKLDRPFNTFSKQEYFEIVPEHKKYSDFNTLGLYRSILENEKLSQDEKFEVFELANEHFQKTFDFLVLKDPRTWFDLTHLGKELTRSQERDLWRDVRKRQEKLLKDKKIKHRNFGIYSKHECGVPFCPYDGLMVHPKSPLATSHIHFKSDKIPFAAKEKSEKRKSERKAHKRIIDRDEEL